jgi:hypothetical protein
VTRFTGTAHRNLCVFMMISRSMFLQMRNVADKICRENENTFYIHQIFQFFCRKSWGFLWDNLKKCDRAGQPLMSIWRARVACCITKAINTHSEYIIRITFSMAKVIIRKHQDVALCACCLYCSYLINLGQDFRLASSTLTLRAYKSHKDTWKSWIIASIWH